jgi:hypothetical protein
LQFFVRNIWRKIKVKKIVFIEIYMQYQSESKLINGVAGKTTGHVILI